MKKIIVIFLCVYALAFGAYYYFHNNNLKEEARRKAEAAAAATPVPTPQATPAIPPLLRRLDVDAMAKRMKKHIDIYERIRDASLKTYAGTRPPGKYDEINAQEIRIQAYLWVWGDYFEEGLLQTCEDNVDRELHDHNAIGNYPLVDCIAYVAFFRDRYSNEDKNMAYLQGAIDRIEAADYPPEMKMWAWLSITKIIAESSNYPATKEGMATSYARLPVLVKKTADSLHTLMKQGLPEDLLYTKVLECFEAVQYNESALRLMQYEIDKAFAAEAPESPLRTLLLARFNIVYAWNARGYGYADTVSAEANRLMQERLANARELLEAAYEKHPEDVRISRTMIKVELGQGGGIPAMEVWFGRAMKADPDDSFSYAAKANYLLPRWYGSPQLSWQFGLDSAKTQRWEAKAPLMLVAAADDLAEFQPDIFSQALVWDPLEKVFRDWLQRYPESTIVRSKFVKYASLGKHWDVVKEQCPILGDNWDKGVFKGVDYSLIKKIADQDKKGK